MFAKAYADFFKKLAPVAASFDALRELAGGKLVDSRPPIAEADIAAFDDRAQIELPRELRSFLLASNGGKLEGGKPFAIEANVKARITWLFAVHREVPQPPDLRKEHDRVRTRIPKGTLPIAAGKGALFLLDRKSRVLEWNAKQQAREVAASFEAFVASVEQLVAIEPGRDGANSFLRIRWWRGWRRQPDRADDVRAEHTSSGPNYTIRL